MKKKNIFRNLSLIFTIITIIGAGYLLVNGGEVNPGYAVIPSLLSVIFSQLSLAQKKDNEK